MWRVLVAVVGFTLSQTAYSKAQFTVEPLLSQPSDTEQVPLRVVIRNDGVARHRVLYWKEDTRRAEVLIELPPNARKAIHPTVSFCTANCLGKRREGDPT
ncbi:MAG: hypothetical protein RMJ83_10595 [Armatimonadota bacterium]|nr:hypothetical protein [Armatimonadota bacterium]